VAEERLAKSLAAGGCPERGMHNPELTLYDRFRTIDPRKDLLDDQFEENKKRHSLNGE
jgi:hypothetical protein